MVKSVSSCCVRGRWVLSNPVTYTELCVYVLFITAAPVLLDKTSGDPYITANTNLTLTVDVSADPVPVATWQLDGGDLPTMTTTTLM